MKTAVSKDGTHIAYDIYGEGQPVIMIGGTMNSRVFGPAPGAQLLGKGFAVYDYDRRGGATVRTINHIRHKKKSKILPRLSKQLVDKWHCADFRQGAHWP